CFVGCYSNHSVSRQNSNRVRPGKFRRKAAKVFCINCLRRARRYLLTMTACTDQVVGDILSSWRYDISGISPEMRKDYESHFEECAHCRSRQRLHRTIDVALIGVRTL